MKKIVTIFGVLYAAAGVLLLAAALSGDAAGIPSAVLTLLAAVPFFALGRTMSETEELREGLEELESRLRAHCRAEEPPGQPQPPREPPKETAREDWTCVKCGCVNKRGTAVCEGCGARFSPWVNPTREQPEAPR